MKTTLLPKSSKWFFLSLIMGLITPHLSFAMSATTKATNNEVTKTETKAKLQHYFWYDGNQKRTVWANPDLVAEFNSSAQSNTENSAQKINIPPTFIQFLTIETDKTTLKSTGKQRSPVLHSSASISGAKKALPGNVIVQMKPSWTAEQINTWFEKQNITAIRPLTFAPNAFLIQSNAGLESLNLANRLYETGDVVLASPNWWQERTTR